MKNIFKKVDAVLADFRPEHSEFQMENFIVGNQGNEWAQYRQALRELAGRYHNIKKYAEDLSRDKMKIERERKRWFKREEVKRLEKDFAEAKEAFKSKAREFYFFYRLARDLKRRIGEITPDRRRALDREMWADKARRMAAIDLISIGGLQRSTVEFIASFPRELRREILADLRPENRQKLLSIID